MTKSDLPAPLSQTVDAGPLAQTVEVPGAGQPAAGVASDREDSPQRIGRYFLLRRLGEGGMGVVYAAYDEDLDRKVAVKLLHSSHREDAEQRLRVVREAQALARVSAPNVVHVYEVGEIHGQMFIAMEFVNGTTLTRWQSTEKRSWHELLRMYVEAGQGLWAAHRAGLTHRDFKPDNVLVGSDGRPRVADFGIARLVDSDAVPMVDDRKALEAPGAPEFVIPPLPALTQAGVALGTPLYMSPEQHVGQKVDGRSDQFSFCVALYEALYGSLPFVGKTLAALRYNVMSGKVQPRPADSQVPIPVHAALLRGLSSEPGQRFPSMEELLAALSFDEARDPAAAPGARFRLTMGLLAGTVLSTLGLAATRALGKDPMLPALVIALGFFLSFGALAIAFRSLLLSNAYHRTMIVLGLVFSWNTIAVRLVGWMMGLSLAQIFTIELASISTLSGLLSAMALPRMWPAVPITTLGTIVAAWRPDYACDLAQCLIAGTICATIVLWNRASHSKPTSPSGPSGSRLL